MDKKLKREAAAKLPRLLEEFDKLYPDAECSLTYENPLQLLISTRLSAQCTDARVNMVTPALFKRYPDCKAFAEADVEELEEYIRSTGFFRSKARNIIDCCKALLERHNGQVPDTMEELVALAGVGRKTANLVLGDAFGKPSYVVDTHCIRLCNRIGLTDNSDPVKIENDLREIIPPERSGKFCHQIVLHGRAYCTARKPKCPECSIRPVCRMAKNLRIE
ncbi:MAG: endonuclease III [Clostridia bacterium]|nr:endonuclease III [Clostridia bacterium]